MDQKYKMGARQFSTVARSGTAVAVIAGLLTNAKLAGNRWQILRN